MQNTLELYYWMLVYLRRFTEYYANAADTNSRYPSGYKKPEKIKQQLDKSVHDLMEIAYKHPLYRKKFDEYNLHPEDFNTAEDLTNFPTLSKVELRDYMNQECDKLDALNKKNYYVNKTSGSSGYPMKILYSTREKACSNANWIGVLMVHGFNPFKDCVMAIKGDFIEKHTDSWIQKMGFMRRYIYCALDDIPFLIDRINEHKPALIYAHKSALVRIVLYARNHGIDIYKPKMILSTSELLDPSSYKIITDYFGEILFNSYGAQEVTALTYTNAGAPNKHYVMYDTHYFLVNNGEKLISPMTLKQGETLSGDIVVTGLFKHDFPVINYEIKDEVVVKNDSGLPYISEIRGRKTDWFLFEDGDRVGFSAFWDVVLLITECEQMRFIQKDYHNIVVQCVQAQGAPAREEIEKKVIAELSKRLKKDNITYSFDWVDALPVDDNMKIKFMICEIKE